VNRETAAAVTAWNTGLLIFFAVVLFALLNDPGPWAAAAPPWTLMQHVTQDDVTPDVERGWGVYQSERCSSCHSVAGQGSPRYPLDGVASRLSAEELRLWVVDPQEVRPGVRKRAYDHLPAEDVADLVSFLEILREP